jgi:hypothetical protein
VVEKHRDRYLLAMSVSDAGSLEGLISAASAIGDLQTMWDELAEVAPPDIKADTEAVRDAWEEQMDAAVTGDFQAILGNALLASGPMGRVDAFIKDNCEFAEALAPIEEVDNTEPGLGYGILGDILARGFGDESPGMTGVMGAVEVFTPEAGPQLVDAESLYPAEAVVSQRWTVAGTPGSSYLVGMVEIRHPASGLDPETWETRMVAVDIRVAPMEVTAENEIVSAPCDEMTSDVTGSRADAVATQIRLECGFQAETMVHGFNPLSGRELWTVDGWQAAEAIGSVVAGNYSVLGPDRHCFAYWGIDTVTGRELWRVDGSQIAVEGRTCEEFGIYDIVYGAGYPNRSQLGHSWHLGASYSEQDFDFEVDGGEPLLIRQPFEWFDPVTGYAAVRGDGIHVYDPATGETIFEVDADRTEALGARPAALIGGRLFLDTTDQHLEIDVESGEIVTESAVRIGYALGVLGEQWAYFPDGVLVPFDEINDYRAAVTDEG